MRVARGAQPPIGIRHILRRRSRNRFPSLVDTLNRCALLGSLQHREHAAEQADVYLTPDLGAIGFGGFSRMEEAVEIGYRSTMASLAGATIEDLRSAHAPLTPDGRRAPTRAPSPGRGASR
jgi:predicted acylesterase/phospholipase RssA